MSLLAMSDGAIAAMIVIPLFGIVLGVPFVGMVLSWIQDRKPENRRKQMEKDLAVKKVEVAHMEEELSRMQGSLIQQ